MTDRALRLLCLLVAGVLSEPSPGRVPKVYNALITSNQNLEPSKAYPVYQPDIHDAGFAFPFQPALYYGGDFPLSNGIPRVPAPPSKEPQPPPSPSPAENPTEKSAESPPESPASTPQPESDTKATPAPPLPPNTQSPIPLNEFGLPAQVLPLGRFDPAFDGFTQVGPFAYSYPGFRFYDPYDPFSLSPYANFPPPLYRPLTNIISQGPPLPVQKVPAPGPVPAAAEPAPTQRAPDGAPPPEPSDLNVLNYTSKDPAIPNVPPPPLPSGGLKTDGSE